MGIEVLDITLKTYSDDIELNYAGIFKVFVLIEK